MVNLDLILGIWIRFLKRGGSFTITDSIGESTLVSVDFLNEFDIIIAKSLKDDLF